MNSMNPCCCCLLRLPEKDLKTAYIREGATEIFTDILEECFQIKLAVNEEDWGVCEECVGRLREANDFKLQVQRSQETLWARLKLQHIKKEPESESKSSDVDDVVYNEEISIEIMPTSDIKSEVTVASESAQGSSTKQLAPHSNSDTKLHETVYQCGICLATFILESNLRIHMKKMHDNFAIQPRNKACDTFEEQFTMFCSGNQPPNERNGRGRGPYACRFCASVFKNRSLLSEHQKDIHKKRKVNSCHICGRVFKKKYLCTEHVRKHTGEKPFVCEICNKKFIAYRWLTSHMRIHKRNVFICDVCNKQYTRKYELILHMRAHNGYKQYECETCKMQFINRSILEQHKAVHSDVKSYSCDICEKRFRRKEHLKCHSLVHSKEKPYPCEICHQKFTTKTNMKRHKKKIHAQKDIELQRWAQANL